MPASFCDSGSNLLNFECPFIAAACHVLLSFSSQKFCHGLKGLGEEKVSVFNSRGSKVPFFRSEIFKMVLEGGASSILKSFVKYIWQEGIWVSVGQSYFVVYFLEQVKQRFIVVFELKRPSLSVQNLFFARAAPKKPSPPLFPITGCEKRRKDVPLAPFFAYFTPSAFYLLLKVKSEVASCLLTQDTFKKSL